MSIVSRYSDTLRVSASKRSGIAPIGSFNMSDETNPVISTNASVRQVTRTHQVSSVPTKVYNETYVPLSFLTSDDTPKVYANEAVVNKLANGCEIDMDTPKPRSKEIMDAYNKVLYGGQLTAFNGVGINLPNSEKMFR